MQIGEPIRPYTQPLIYQHTVDPQLYRNATRILTFVICFAFIANLVEGSMYSAKIVYIHENCILQPSAIIQALSYVCMFLYFGLLPFLLTNQGKVPLILLVLALITKIISFFAMAVIMDSAWGRCYVADASIRSFMMSDLYWMAVAVAIYLLHQRMALVLQLKMNGFGLRNAKKKAADAAKAEELEAEKEKRIQVAIRFLQNPELKNAPLSGIKAFFKKKGLSDEEIEQAIAKAKEPIVPKETLGNIVQTQYITNTQSDLSQEELQQIIESSQQSNSISIRNRQLKIIDPQILSLQSLQILIVSFNRITIPDQISQLTSLKVFHASGCKLFDHQISKNLYQVNTLEELVLSNNNLIYQDEVVNLKNLIVLDLSRNDILRIPEEIKNLTNLQLVNYSYNNITRVPEELSQMRIKKVNIDKNPI